MSRTVCPGCKQLVPLLHPRPAKGGRVAMGWRRKAHAVAGDLGAPGAVRCRYPVDLSTTEPPQENHDPHDHDARSAAG